MLDSACVVVLSVENGPLHVERVLKMILQNCPVWSPRNLRAG